MFAGFKRKVQGRSEEIHLCPKCNDTKGHLYYNTISKKFICHRCNYKGIKKKENYISPYKDLEEARLKLQEYTEEKQEIEYEIEPPENLKSLTEKQIKYLKYRLKKYGDTRDYIDLYKIKDNSQRIYFPTFSGQNLIYHVSRTIWKHEKPRYKNCENIPKAGSIFGLEQWKKLNRQELIICEGPLSALSFGLGKAVALMGKNYTETQVRNLKKIRHDRRDIEYIICLDADARKEAIELWKSLSGSTIILLQEGDPNDYTKSELEKLIDGRLNYTPENLMKVQKWKMNQ